MIGITRILALEAIKNREDDAHQDPLPEMDLPALAAAPAQAELLQKPQAAAREQERALSAFTSLSPPRRDLIAAAYLLGESKQRLAKRTGVASGNHRRQLERRLAGNRSGLPGHPGRHAGNKMRFR